MLQSVIDHLLVEKANIKTLEAGCGSASHIDFKRDAYILGVDISEIQLKKNKNLSQRVVGDIQCSSFRPSTFDVIICWDVLEHLDKPEMALKSFSRMLKEDGIIIFAAPNLLSIKGIIAKYTPHFLHVFLYRNIYGIKDASKNGKGPFKTYLRFSMRPNAIRKFGAQNGFSIEYLERNDIGHYLRGKNKGLYFFYFILKSLFEYISFGIISESDFVIVMKKKKT